MDTTPKALNIPELEHDLLEENEAVTVLLRKRNGDPLMSQRTGEPVTVSVLGDYSTAVQKAVYDNSRKMGKERRTEMTPELLHNNRLRLVCAAVVDWTLDDGNGQPVPCTAENVRALCSRFRFIMEQIEEVMRLRSGFFANDSPS